jgi:hypothetical protein
METEEQSKVLSEETELFKLADGSACIGCFSACLLKVLFFLFLNQGGKP